MKKIKLNGKLVLNKETVSQLNEAQMLNLNGAGYTFSLYVCQETKTCPTMDVNCVSLNCVTLNNCLTGNCLTQNCYTANCQTNINCGTNKCNTTGADTI